MALTFTPSSEKWPCPEFEVLGVDSIKYNRNHLKTGKPFLVAFICNHCPYVQAIEQRLITLGADLKNLGIPMLAISSNDGEAHPEDAYPQMQVRAKEKGYTFPYAVDESQEVAKSFGAVCTPDFFLFDASGNLAWRGRLDDNWKDENKVSRRELYIAATALLNNQTLPEEIPSMGCSIKWKGHK